MGRVRFDDSRVVIAGRWPSRVRLWLMGIFPGGYVLRRSCRNLTTAEAFVAVCARRWKSCPCDCPATGFAGLRAEGEAELT